MTRRKAPNPEMLRFQGAVVASFVLTRLVSVLGVPQEIKRMVGSTKFRICVLWEDFEANCIFGRGIPTWNVGIKDGHQENVEFQLAAKVEKTVDEIMNDLFPGRVKKQLVEDPK